MEPEIKQLNKTNIKVHFASGSTMWETPQATFDALASEFGPFDLDVCAIPENAKCVRYFSPEIDGLLQQWRGTCWMNPPYGRDIGTWMSKAYESSLEGATVVCLVPSRTDTAWWHDYAMKGRIRFLSGRLKFVGAKDGAPFPSAVVVFAQNEPASVESRGNAVQAASGRVDLQEDDMSEENKEEQFLKDACREIGIASHHLTLATLNLIESNVPFIGVVTELKNTIGDLQITVKVFEKAIQQG